MKKFKMTLKLFDPVSGVEEETIIKKVLKSHFWASGTGGGFVSKFEKAFNNYIGSKYCAAVNSGTAALHLALSLINIRNKEVILPSLSFVSTAHAIVYNGGKPVFTDVEYDTLCLDPNLVRDSLSKKTEIILPVHFGGMPCDMKEFLKICKNSNLQLIQDAAHAVGTTYQKKKIGSLGMACCFSFHPVKNLAMPSGGAITLNGKYSKQMLKILYARRWCGISERIGPNYDVSDLGWNYYMNEFSAAIGIEQLKKLEFMNSKRKNIAKRYSKELTIERKMPYNNDCSYHLYWILVKNRSQFMKKMAERKIETGIHYKPIHQMKFYKSKLKLPVTETIGKQIVSIPIHPNLTDEDVDYIINIVNKLSR